MSSRPSKQKSSSRSTPPTTTTQQQLNNTNSSSSAWSNQVQQQPNSPTNSSSSNQKMNNKGSKRRGQRRRSDNGNQSSQQSQHNGNTSQQQYNNNNQQAVSSKDDNSSIQHKMEQLNIQQGNEQQQTPYNNNWEQQQQQQQQSQQHLYSPPPMSNSSNEGGGSMTPPSNNNSQQFDTTNNNNLNEYNLPSFNTNNAHPHNDNNNWHLHTNHHPSFTQQQQLSGMMSHPNNFPIQYNNNNNNSLPPPLNQSPPHYPQTNNINSNNQYPIMQQQMPPSMPYEQHSTNNNGQEQYQFNNNMGSISHSNSGMPPNNMPPSPSPNNMPQPNNGIINSKYIYKWDNSNIIHFIEVRNQMLDLLFGNCDNSGEGCVDSGSGKRSGLRGKNGVRNDSNRRNDNNTHSPPPPPPSSNNFVKSHSDNAASLLLMSPTRPMSPSSSRLALTNDNRDNKNSDGYKRASSVGSGARRMEDEGSSSGSSEEVNRGMSMPILDNNNSPMRQQQQQQQLPRQQNHHKGDRISTNNKQGNSRGISGNSSQGGPEGLGFTSPRSSPISNNNKVINLQSSTTSNNNNQERTVLEKLNEMLPPLPPSPPPITTTANTNHFITAIRTLFLDSSLPLAGYPSSSLSYASTNIGGGTNNTHRGASSTSGGGNSEEREMSIITTHPLSTINNNNNSSTIINLIPKIYLQSWIKYVRNLILIENIQSYFMAWERVDLQSRLDQGRGGSRGGDGNEEGTELPIREGGNSDEGIEWGNKGGAAIEGQGSNTQGQGQHTNGEGQGPWYPAGDSSSSKSEGGEGDNTSTRYYTLLPETIKVLAALSILSDQYLLHQDTNYNTTGSNQQQHEFVHWLEELMYCWNCWVENVIEFRLHMEARSVGNGQGPQMGMQQHQGPGHDGQESCPPHGFSGDEKKHEDYSPPQQQYHQPPPHFLHPHHPSHSAGGSSSPSHLLQHSSSSHSFQQQPHIPYPAPYPHFTFPPYQQPGPVDCRSLTTIEYPLVMHEHVLLSMRGILGCSNGDDANYDEYGNDDKVAICPVSTGFYELLRNTQGVICSSDDEGGGDHPISYCPPTSYVDDPQGTSSGMNDTAPPNKPSALCSLLFHDQWKVNDISTPSSTTTDGNATPNKNNSRTGSPNGSGDDDDGYPLFALSPDAHQDVNQGGYQHPYPYANNEANNFPKLQQSNQNHVRPIEFQRRLLSVPLSKDNDENEEESSSPGRNGYLNVAKKKKDTPSPYSRLMQEALASKKSMDQEADGNSSVSSSAINLAVDTTSTKESSVGYTIEVFPVEFKYVIVDEDAGGISSGAVATDDNTTGLPQHSHQGIALASRTSSISEVLHDLQRAAVPNKPNSCVRIWKRSVCNEATKSGDGYDLLDDASLFAEPPVSSPKSMSSKSKQLVVEELTIEQWLGMVPLNSKTAKEQACTPGQVVELLIEVRRSPTSKWIRESLELENRVQPGDYVDAQDSARKWYEAIVREVKPDTIKVHYFGWGSKWDYELPRRQGTKSKLSPPVPLWTKTAQWRNQIKVGQEVEVRESTSLVQRPKWHRATVLAVGDENDMPRELEGGAELELLDVNDVGAKIPLNLLKRRRQILVDVPQEIPNLPTATPLTPPRNRNGSVVPVAQPPYRRWVNLYGEEVCKVNTHKTSNKTPSKSPTTLNYTMETQRAPVEVMKPFNNIHGSGFVRESLRGIPPATGVVGLHNLGNSCYMNSILQCINHIKPITQYFLKGDYINEINKRNPLGTGGRIATAYAAFLNDIYSNDYSILAPRILKQTVAVYAPQFNNNYQHDSQEFCQYIFDGLHEDLNRVKEKPYVEDVEAFGMEDSKAAMESWKNHLLRHDSIFVDHTQGMHRSHLTCPKCGRESIKFDVYSSISLPLVPAKERSSIPLKDCLDQFAAGEQLDSHNAWYCATCKKHVCALKLITLWNTPDVLVLHLKRFTYEKCPDIDGRLLRRKIEDRVDFPIDRLDLSSYVLGPIDPEAPPIYKLFGVSEHMGTTQNSGHYTATVRNSEDGNWYRYNDSQVGSTSGDAAVTGGAYLLFYQRAKGSLKWAGMEKQIIMNEGGYVDSDGFAVVGKKKNKKK